MFMMLSNNSRNSLTTASNHWSVGRCWWNGPNCTISVCDFV